jgi:hypothetical protein
MYVIDDEPQVTSSYSCYVSLGMANIENRLLRPQT